MVKDHESVFPEILETIKSAASVTRSVNVTIPSLEEAFISLMREEAIAPSSS